MLNKKSVERCRKSKKINNFDFFYIISIKKYKFFYMLYEGGGKMFNSNNIYNRTFICSKCNKPYKLVKFNQNDSKEKICNFEFIGYTSIQTECPFCNCSNCVNL